MILRKPFAILIKNFKRIHFLLSLFAFYLVYRTNTILSFYNEYVASYTSVIGKDLTGQLFNGLMYVSIFILLLGSIIILGLMVFKHKPVKLYIFNIIVYIAVAIIYALTYSVTNSLEIGLVDIRTLKMIQDLLTSVFMVQIISLCILAVRATGFNIKKFDFVKDLEELEIEDVDNEEFEVNIDLDSDKWKRKINRTIRHAKYIYKENKVILLLLLFVIVGVTSAVIYINVGVYNKLYKKNEAFSAGLFTMKLADSYTTSEDVKGNQLLKDETLVAILVDVRNNSTKDQTLDSARFVLKVQDHYFYHLPEYKEKVKDLGTTYTGQTIPNNFTKYMFVYKIPTGFLDEKMVLQYTDFTDKIVQMKIAPTDLDKNNKNIVSNLNESIKFTESILNQTELIFTNYSLNRTMKVDYNYCINSGCYPSSEYLKPTYTGKEKKILMSLTGTLRWDDKLPIKSINDLSAFIQTFGEIHYTINGVEKSSSSPIQVVKPTKTTVTDTCYIEVPEELIIAENIQIVFHVRNQTYIYNVK